MGLGAAFRSAINGFRYLFSRHPNPGDMEDGRVFVGTTESGQPPFASADAPRIEGEQKPGQKSPIGPLSWQDLKIAADAEPGRTRREWRFAALKRHLEDLADPRRVMPSGH